jgi:hypothetical protein
VGEASELLKRAGVEASDDARSLNPKTRRADEQRDRRFHADPLLHLRPENVEPHQLAGRSPKPGGAAARIDRGEAVGIAAGHSASDQRRREGQAAVVRIETGHRSGLPVSRGGEAVGAVGEMAHFRPPPEA